MRFYLSLLALAPLLLWQGRRVRRITPQLPEPEGPRSGTAGQGRPLGLLIVGDSAAAGVGVERQAQALSGQLQHHLQADHALRWRLLARSGDRAAPLLEALQMAPPQAFDVAVVSIGVNDVTGLTRRRDWARQLRAILKLLAERYAVRQVFLCGVPPMHRFPALPQPLRGWLGLRARQLNAVMQTVAAAQAGVSYLPMSDAARLDGMAGDGFHPGAGVYRAWAEHLASRIRALALDEADPLDSD